MFAVVCYVVFASAVPSIACPPRCSPIDDIKAFLLSQQLTVDRISISIEDVIMLNGKHKVSIHRIEHILPMLTIKLARYDWRFGSHPNPLKEFTFTFTVHNLTIIIPSGGGKPTVVGDNIYPWNEMRQVLGSSCGRWLTCRFTKDNRAGIAHALLNSGYFGDVCENACLNPSCARCLAHN